MMLSFRQFYLNEMAALPGREKDPNADEKTIVDILEKIHNHKNEKERNHYISHPQGVISYVEKHMMTGKKDYDRGTRLAASAAQSIMNHESKEHGKIRDIFKRRTAKIERSGNKPSFVQEKYKNLGGKNSTSRADISVFCEKTKAKHTFSVKKNDAQVASAESGEFRALGHVAAEKTGKTNKHVEEIKARVDKIVDHQKKSENAKDDNEYRTHATKANGILQQLRKDYPEWEHHVAREAATGHEKFGKSKEGSADNMLSYDDKTGKTKIWKSEDKESPYPNGMKMEIRTGKGRKGKRNPKEKVDTRRRRQIAFRAEPIRTKKSK